MSSSVVAWCWHWFAMSNSQKCTIDKKNWLHSDQIFSNWFSSVSPIPRPGQLCQRKPDCYIYVGYLPSTDISESVNMLSDITAFRDYEKRGWGRLNSSEDCCLSAQRLFWTISSLLKSNISCPLYKCLITTFAELLQKMWLYRPIYQYQNSFQS